MSLCLALRSTFMTAFRAHVDNPGYSPHLKILNYINKLLFAIYVNIQRFPDILGGHYSANCSQARRSPVSSGEKDSFGCFKQEWLGFEKNQSIIWG